MAKTKKLTIAELDKMENELNQKETIKILDGKYEVNIHKVFKDSDIEDMLLNYMTILQELNKSPEANLKNSASLYITLILRHFTDLPIPESNEIDELIRITKVLKNKGITTEVTESLPKDQLEYLGTRAQEASVALEKLIKGAETNGGSEYETTGVIN
ncbi:hypothetical protein GRF59_15225 [Paenibacillus sp. HJL G12]|uniref:Uncharacterized protein n=1 Tax=Paenibacillus dendrobii TaxID=2691084 RepID=A0A7X3IJ84_9BACL|nr:hypothetical protein [Paenibacillus dendrobii]MWV44973.1 hypothetical protein [Paenibacillus dendrobii]